MSEHPLCLNIDALLYMGLELMAKLMWTHYVASIALHYNYIDIIISYTTVDKIVLYNILIDLLLQ